MSAADVSRLLAQRNRALREVLAQRDKLAVALSQVSFYARVNHGTKCKDYGEVADAVLKQLGLPMGTLLTEDYINAKLAKVPRAGR